jgi:uncharacterized membrane protein
MKIVAILVAFLTLVGPAYAQEISEYRVKTYVTDLTLQEEISLTLVNTHETELAELTYPFNGMVRDLKVYDPLGELESSSAYRSGKTYITCTFRRPLSSGENQTVTYKFSLYGQIERKENIYILSTAHSLLANVKNFYLTITLPEGYGVAKEGISPLPVEVGSDGRKVILRWRIEEPIPTELRGFKVIVLYEKLVMPWWKGREVYLSLIPLAAILVVGAVLLYKRKGRGLEEKIEILKGDEREIMKLIIEKDGIDQREIQRKTEFSKTKVSKILSELEKRGVIRKEPVGRRNKIFLAKKLKET